MKLLLTILLASASLTSQSRDLGGYSQTLIQGKITDHRNEPIPGANVFILDSYDGTSSAADGTFSFSVSESGMQVLVVRFIGYKEHRQTLELNGQAISINVVLREEINELQAVTISAGAFTAEKAVGAAAASAAPAAVVRTKSRRFMAGDCISQAVERRP